MKQDGLVYAAQVPAEQLRVGTLRYEISVQDAEGYTTFPSMQSGLPTDWDFYGQAWQARVVPQGAPILLFDAAVDANLITADHRGVNYDLVPSDRPGSSAIELLATNLEEGEHDQSMRFFFKDKINGRTSDVDSASRLVLYGKSMTDTPTSIQLALTTAEGVTYGASVTVEPQFGSYSVRIGALKQVRAPNIPHGYPVFIPFWNSVATHPPLDLTRIESALVSIGPGIPASEYQVRHGIQIERIWLDLN
jgi:hypothetical protein